MIWSSQSAQAKMVLNKRLIVKEHIHSRIFLINAKAMKRSYEQRSFCRKWYWMVLTLIIFAMAGTSTLVAFRVLKWKFNKGTVAGRHEVVLAMTFFLFNSNERPVSSLFHSLGQRSYSLRTRLWLADRRMTQWFRKSRSVHVVYTEHRCYLYTCVRAQLFLDSPDSDIISKRRRKVILL